MPRTAFPTNVRPATEEQIAWIEKVTSDMPPFGISFNKSCGETAAEWTETRAKELSDYLIENGALKKCQYLAHTKGWNDHLDKGVTTICRLSCDQITEALNQTSWLKGTDLVDEEYYSDGVLAEELPKNLKYHIVGLFRLLAHSQGEKAESRGIETEHDEKFKMWWYPHKDDFDPYSDSVYSSLAGAAYHCGKMGKGDCYSSQDGECPNLARRKSPPKKTRAKAPKKTKQPVLDEEAVREYIKNSFNLQQLSDLQTHISICRLRIQADTMDETPTEPFDSPRQPIEEPEVFTCPEEWQEIDLEEEALKKKDTYSKLVLPDGHTKIWQNDDTEELCFPCANVEEATKYEFIEDWSDEKYSIEGIKEIE